MTLQQVQGFFKRVGPSIPTPPTKKAKADETDLPQPFDNLPDELLLSIFYEIAKEDLKNVRTLSVVCRRWHQVTPDRIIFQLYIERKYPHLLPNTPTTGGYFEQASRLASNLAYLSKEFSGKERNLVNYSVYLNKLTASLNIPNDVYNSMPYFDLRCLAWLEVKNWMPQFNRICPQLKNVQVLQASGIGTEIGFFKLKLPELPVAGEVLGIGKVVVDGIGSFFGAENASDASKNINRFLVFCIHAVAKASTKLKALHCAKTTLLQKEVQTILQTFPTITYVDITECPKMPFYARNQLETRFPNVTFKKNQ